jgi:UDP-GlcNAc:undecaprenyl-phosphate/decaprenyl-phosphate GlcNAc-1-phosphate transferase
LISEYLWMYVAVLAAAYLGTRLLVPVNIRFSRQYGWLAHPNERTIHTVPMATAGGLSFGLVMVLLQLILGWQFWKQGLGGSLIKLGLISLLVIGMGLFDDRYKSRVRYKLLGQILIALLMYYAGYKVFYLTNPWGDHFLLGWLSLPVTVIWFLLTMNVINLIDGLDGLAAGITCIVSLVLAVIGFLSNNPLVLALTAILLGANLAFLKYNFFPAKIFMGDTGSLLIGLNIAAISTAGNPSYKGITTMTLIVPIIALAIPIIDTGLAVFRRGVKGASIFRADKAHLHHYLLKLGLSQTTIALITYFITALFGLAAIGFSFSSHKILFSLVVLLLTVLIILAYYLIHRGQKQ